LLTQKPEQRKNIFFFFFSIEKNGEKYRGTRSTLLNHPRPSNVHASQSVEVVIGVQNINVETKLHIAQRKKNLGHNLMEGIQQQLRAC